MPMFAAAGMVVTEISTPISAPDLAVLSAQHPGRAGRQRDDRREDVGVRRSGGRGWCSLETHSSGVSDVSLKIGGEDEAAKRSRAGSRQQRAAGAHRQRAAAAARARRRARRSARTRGRPPSRRDQDLGRVLEDADGGDDRGQHHEQVTKTPESSTFSFVRCSTSSQTTASAGAPGAWRSASSAKRAIAVSISSRLIDPSSCTLEVLEVVQDHARVLARDVAQDQVAVGPLRRRRGSTTTLITEGVSASTSRTASVRSGGETIRRWIMAAPA